VILLALFSGGLFAQEVTRTEEYYLKKSSNQRTAGLILLGGGTVLMLVGISAGSGGDSKDMGYGSNFDKGVALVGIGLAADIISIPLLINAAKNKRKAEAAVAIIPVQGQSSTACVAPGITVRFRYSGN
jgi:hypothetical protein